MKRMASVIAMFLLAVLLPLTATAAETREQALLLGTWRHQSLQQFADGKLVRSITSPDGTTLQFKADGTWISFGPSYKASGTFRWVRDGSVETTIVESSLPQQIGWASAKQVQINGRTLSLTTVYDEAAMNGFQPRADGTRPKEMRVISVFEKVVPK